MGRTTSKPQLKESEGEKKTAYLHFDLAVQTNRNGDADFIPCVAFNNNAQFINSYVDKGQKIVVEGKLKSSSWEDEKGKHFKTEVVVNNVYFAENKKVQSNTELRGEFDNGLNEYV